MRYILDKIKTNKGMVNIDNKVVINIPSEANSELPPYCFAIMAQFAATGIPLIITDIPIIMVSCINNFKTNNTTRGNITNLIKEIAYNLHWKKIFLMSTVDKEAPIKIMERGVVKFPSISTG